jgi:diaminohydroxyphosphoribosylaminopyrimidine deaminase/5-amino-6-(5-phosphoribosylamino)uracil reductase
MALALAEAERAGHVSPNPAVGCVIVGDGRALGRGFTLPPGSAHAEVVALREAGGRARGATAYVTLEPCSHWGRTPPCADALIEAGVAAVVCAIADPDAQVRGRGLARLRAAGIAVTVGDGADAARRQLAAFLTHRVTGRPLVIAKFAASLDGRTATRTGDSQWISGEAARAVTRTQRGRIDAILVGVGTVIADNPWLTARAPDGLPLPHQPLRVVLDSGGRTPPDARLLDTPPPALLATTNRSPAAWRDAVRARGADLCLLPAAADGRVDLPALLDELGHRQVLSLLVEGGATVLGAFFDAGLVDRVQAVIAPLIIGGTEAPPAVGGLGAARLDDARRLYNVTVERLGDDVLITGDLREPPADGERRTANSC